MLLKKQNICGGIHAFKIEKNILFEILSFFFFFFFFFLNLCGIYSDSDCPRNNHSSGPGVSRSVTYKIFLSHLLI